MSERHSQSSSFVVRIWREQAGRQGDCLPIWRGWVQNTRLGEAAYVKNLAELISFMEHWTGKLSSPDEEKQQG